MKPAAERCVGTLLVRSASPFIVGYFIELLDALPRFFFMLRCLSLWLRFQFWCWDVLLSVYEHGLRTIEMLLANRAYMLPVSDRPGRTLPVREDVSAPRGAGCPPLERGKHDRRLFFI